MHCISRDFRGARFVILVSLTSALRSIVADVMKLPEANRYFGEMLTGVGIRYDLGDDDPRVGTLAKNEVLTLADGREQRLDELMLKGGGLFVSPVERALPREVRQVRVEQGAAWLVRPDGCVAWTEASTSSLEQAVARWF